MKLCVGRWTAAASVDTWFITISTFILISQVASQQLIIEQSPKNATVSVGETVTLTCVFSQQVDCNWLKDDQPYRIKAADGNTFTGESSTGENTRDCSIRISAVTENDFAQWNCASYGSKGVRPVRSEGAWITKRVTPTAPVVLFNNESVSEIKLPSSETPRDNMVCVAERGNPSAELSWEVNGTPYLGRLERVEVGPNLYTVQLFWNRGGGWQIFDNSTDVICKAKHPGFTNTMTARVEFKRNYAPRTVKVWAEGFDPNRDVAIRRGDSVLLACISDGQPAPTYTWELWSEEDKTWKLYNNSHNEQNITVTIEQLGKYRCKGSNDLNKYSPTTSLNQLVVSESIAPRTVKVLAECFVDRDIAIRRGESVQLACISDGHPVPLRYTWELWSEEDKTWKFHNNSGNEQNITITTEQLGKYRCKANNSLNQHSPTTSINQLTVSERDGTTVKLVKESGALGFTAIVSVVLGVTLVITNLILATCVIRLRRQLRSRRNETTPPAKAQSNVTTAGNRYTTGPVSRGAPSTSAGEVVLYEDATSYVRQCSVRRENTDSNGYLEALPVYAEIRDQSLRMKGEDDRGYVVLI